MKFSNLSIGRSTVQAAYMLGVGAWMGAASLINLGLIGQDRLQKQFQPLAEAIVGSSAPLVAALLQGAAFCAEASICAAMVAGVLVPWLRPRFFALGTALQTLLFSGFLATTFVFKGVGELPNWTQYPTLIAFSLVAYALTSPRCEGSARSGSAES